MGRIGVHVVDVKSDAGDDGQQAVVERGLAPDDVFTGVARAVLEVEDLDDRRERGGAGGRDDVQAGVEDGGVVVVRDDAGRVRDQAAVTVECEDGEVGESVDGFGGERAGRAALSIGVRSGAPATLEANVFSKR